MPAPARPSQPSPSPSSGATASPPRGWRRPRSSIRRARTSIADATLSLEGRRGSAPDLPVAPLSPEARTGADGRFALEHVPPDAGSVQAAKPGYLARLVSLGPLPEDGDAPPLAIALTPRAPDAGAHLELTGIGAVLQARGEALDVQGVLPGGGAADAGLAPGDAILAVDSASVTDLRFSRAAWTAARPIACRRGAPPLPHCTP